MPLRVLLYERPYQGDAAMPSTGPFRSVPVEETVSRPYARQEPVVERGQCGHCREEDHAANGCLEFLIGDPA
jgi:hypothetical protein